MPRLATLTTAFLLLPLMALSASAQTTRFVDALNGSDDGNTCSNASAPCETFVHTIDVSSSGDVIEIAAGLYTEMIEIDKSLVLHGADEATTIIQAHAQPGEAGGRVITIDGPFEVEISDLTVRHGVADGAFPEDVGGGLFNTGGASLTVSNVTFRDNTSDSVGGGIGQPFGGVILVLMDVSFQGNVAGGDGGGLYSSSDSISLTNVAFVGNEIELGSAGLGGGMFHNKSGSTVTIENVSFAQNHARTHGGGMYLRASADAEIEMENLSFIENHAGGGGGGLYLDHTDAVMMLNIVFENNSASSVGGGMRLHNSSPTMVGATFMGNTAAVNGGGMYSSSNQSGDSAPELTAVTFSGNTAEISGGGLHVDDASPTLTDVTFSGNVASGSETFHGGGGMFSSGSSSNATLTRVTFVENTAERGGGIHVIGVEGSGGATLREVGFRENTATSIGGGMYVRESDSDLVNVAFTGNTADITAGGMFNVDGAPTLSNVTFRGNVAHSPESAHGAGGMRNLNSSPTLTNVTFSGNNSGASGGGMINSGESAPELSNVIFWNNQASGSTTSTSASISNLSSTSIPTISHSLIANSGGSENWDDAIGIDGGNNLDEDPLFLEPIDPGNAPTAAGNLRLQDGSPAIDAGGPDTDPALFATNDNGNPIDLLGNPRFFNDTIDMGPFEWNPNVADEVDPDELAEALTAPYPNPARASATFTVAVGRAQDVTVEVFDTLGRRVQTLYEGALAVSTAETLTFDASALPAGVYIIRAAGENLAETRRVTIIR